jgi:hypothetical protein
MSERISISAARMTAPANGCEVQSHDAYGTPRELFGKFFGLTAETVYEVLGDDWSPEIDAAWRKLLADIDALVAQSQA